MRLWALVTSALSRTHSSIGPGKFQGRPEPALESLLSAKHMVSGGWPWHSAWPGSLSLESSGSRGSGPKAPGFPRDRDALSQCRHCTQSITVGAVVFSTVFCCIRRFAPPLEPSKMERILSDSSMPAIGHGQRSSSLQRQCAAASDRVHGPITIPKRVSSWRISLSERCRQRDNWNALPEAAPGCCFAPAAVETAKSDTKGRALRLMNLPRGDA